MAAEPAVRPMNIIEKIITHHAVGLSRPFVTPGEAVCVRVDWTMANELTLVGISDMWTKIGRPPVANKERVWLAVDHTVDPRNYHEPKPSALVKLADEFAAETKIDDYWRPNTTIMHTEFARQRAQPGQIVIGADSHTCSAGGMGALAIGLGAGDVTLPLVTGHTWLQVPETCLIEFVGEPRFGVGGKDIILHVLGVLKRNTVANERAVEWRGPGLRFMSADARFAVANMTTEFGGIAGVFEADEQTARALAARTAPGGPGGLAAKHAGEGLFFRADPGAQYAFSATIDLGDIVPQVALFPSPDNCRPVTDLAAGGSAEGAPMRLDGCFIGACTTTQEDLILAALVLEAALAQGLKPVPTANPNARRVTPGSLQIVDYLRRHGILDIYERAGFVVGAPGCSYCLGIAADVAGDGEVWLSSQNRNFRNRMGKGSIANLASAVVVAASSFGMVVTDPAPFLAAVDRGRYDELREWLSSTVPSAAAGGCHSRVAAAATAPAAAAPAPAPAFAIVEPSPVLVDASAPAVDEDPGLSDPAVWSHLPGRVRGTVQRFGDCVDTDAIIPAQMMGCSPADMVKHGGTADMGEDAFLGLKCFAYVRPEFVPRVRAGATIVVAGEAFGCGSSREEAVKALKQSGVSAVIAKSFAFIYARNQPNMALLGVVVRDEAFYAAAGEGADVEVDVAARKVIVHAAGAPPAAFPFALSRMEERFLKAGGVERLYKVFKQGLFKALVKGPRGLAADSPAVPLSGSDGGCGEAAASAGLAW